MSARWKGARGGAMRRVNAASRAVCSEWDEGSLSIERLHVRVRVSTGFQRTFSSFGAADVYASVTAFILYILLGSTVYG